MLYAKLNGVLIESRTAPEGFTDDDLIATFRADLEGTYSPSDLEIGTETKETIDGWWDAIYEASRTYATRRAEEYPAIVDQLDDIFHNGIDGWKATIQVTKDKYPKE